jgi:hypothetical protein
LKIIEDWKNALDQHKFAAAILMDLYLRLLTVSPMTSYFKNPERKADK